MDAADGLKGWMGSGCRQARERAVSSEESGGLEPRSRQAGVQVGPQKTPSQEVGGRFRFVEQDRRSLVPTKAEGFAPSSQEPLARYLLASLHPIACLLTPQDGRNWTLLPRCLPRHPRLCLPMESPEDSRLRQKEARNRWRLRQKEARNRWRLWQKEAQNRWRLPCGGLLRGWAQKTGRPRSVQPEIGLLEKGRASETMPASPEAAKTQRRASLSVTRGLGGWFGGVRIQTKRLEAEAEG